MSYAVTILYADNGNNYKFCMKHISYVTNYKCCHGVGLWGHNFQIWHSWNLCCCKSCAKMDHL